MNRQIINALEGGVAVVTATRRLARTLRDEYNAARQASGAKAWDAPAVLSWEAWMAELWEQFIYANPNPPVRLSLWQELALWERVIRESPQSGEILQLHATATAAQEAWARAIEWRLDLSQIESAGNEDSRAFAGWLSGAERL